MEREKFAAAEYAQKINACRDRLFSLYAKFGYEDVLQDTRSQLEKISDKETIRVTFAGQYTAGKSSIISALTRDNDIIIDSDVSTDVEADYQWSGGVVLTDTPGLYTENPVHSQRTIETIKKSDLLVYCITSDLFNQYTKADFEKWACEVGYVGKMFWVVNKMSKESGDYSTLVSNYSTSIDRALSPHSIAEFPASFLDARDYRNGLKNGNADLIALSHFDQFVAQLNQFIAQKGQLGKLDTPIKILKSSIDKVSEQNMDSEQDRAYAALLSRIEKRVDQRRSQVNADIHNCIRRGLRPIIDKGYELSRFVGIENLEFTENDFNELVASACEGLNRDLSAIIDSNIQALNDDISEVVNSETASFFFNAVDSTVSGKRRLFENKRAKVSRAQFEAINDVVSKITGKTVKFATKEGNASAEFFIKASEASGSQLHNAVKFIGGKIGYKFKPWQAANIAKGIGNAAKFVGPALSALGLFFDVKETIDEAEQSERIAREQIKFRQSFVDTANELEQQYMEKIEGIFSEYRKITDRIAANRSKVQQVIADHDAMSKELNIIKLDLTAIQDSIF